MPPGPARTGSRPAWVDVPGAGPTAEAAETADRSDLPARADAVVVGLGASGLEAICLLARHGVDVVGLDAVGVGAGAAGANGGFLLAGLADFHHVAVERHGRDVALRWTAQTLDELERLFDTEPTARRVGSLRIAADEAEAADCRAQLAAMRADGLQVEAYEGVEGTGLLLPTDGAYHPIARCRRLAAQAVADGALLVAPARVASAATGRVILDDGASVTCRWVLVAVDGGLEDVVPTIRDRVRTTRLQMRATAPDRGVALPRPVYRRYGYDYAQQTPTGEVLIGGGRDLEEQAAWGGAAATTTVVQDHLDDWATALGVTAAVTHRWAARAAWTTDRLPIDTEVEPAVHVVGGYSGHGNVIGGMLARRAADTLLA